MPTAAKESTSNVSFLDLPDDQLGNYSPFVESTGSPAVEDEANAGAAAGATESLADTKAQEAAPGAAEELKEDEADDKQEAKPAEGQAADATPAGEAKTDKVEDGAAADKSGEAKPDPTQTAKATADTDATKKTEEKKEAPATSSIDYEAEYKKLMAPFKANGREIAVQSVDEAVQLMQMGANYNKKMAALKPNLALLKLLEQNNLLSEEKISYLIDLDKKVPGAVNKLVKDSGIDPMDLDTKKESDYKPTARKVDQRELELDEVLDAIQDTPSYSRTLEVVSKQWDQASKQAVADAPQLLNVINSHIDAGIYDLISAEVERERLFGRLKGLSDIEAYRQVGDAIHARGGFAHLGRQQQDTSTAKTVVVAAPKQEDDDKLKDKKRAAAPAKPAVAAPAPAVQDFNPLAMSDEEFAKVKAKFA